MAVYTFVSASGSPGVTTTALGLAFALPGRTLLIEADPTGASGLLAGYWRGELDHAGLVELVMAHRAGVLAEALPRIAMDIDGTGVSVLIGTKSHEQAGSLTQLWDPLLGVLRDSSMGWDHVLIDAGQLGVEGWPRPLVSYSDTTFLVTRSTLRSLAGARSWARTLSEDVLPDHHLLALLVGENQPYRASQVASTLGLGVAGSIDWDPARAAVYSDGAARPRLWLGGDKAADRAFELSGYASSLRTVAQHLLAMTPAAPPLSAVAVAHEDGSVS